MGFLAFFRAARITIGLPDDKIVPIRRRFQFSVRDFFVVSASETVGLGLLMAK